MIVRRAFLLMVVASSFLLVAACDGGPQRVETDEEPPETVAETPESPDTTQPVQVESGGERASASIPARSIDRRVSGGLEPVGIVPSVGLLHADPVRWGDLLIVGTADGIVAAHTVPTAEASLSWETGYPVPIEAIAATPTSVLVAAGSAVEALSPVTGEPIWRMRPGEARVTSRITVTRGSAYLGTADGEIMAIALEDGTVRWRVLLDAAIVDRILIADGVAYAATENGSLTAISASSGEELWDAASAGGLAAGPAIDGARVALVTIDGAVIVYGAEGVLAEWEIEAAPVLVAPTWYDGDLLIVDGAGAVALFAESGELLWRYELTGHLAGVPARIGDALVLGEAGGGVVSIDLRSGAEISRISVGAPLRGEASLFGDRLWWGLGDGSIREIGLDGNYREAPLFTSEGSWVLPETGTFRLEDERVALTMRSGRDAVFEITVTSAPNEDLVLRVVSSDGAEVATNMGKVTLSRTVRAALDAGQSYELIVSRSNPRGEITISVQTRQLD